MTLPEAVTGLDGDVQVGGGGGETPPVIRPLGPINSFSAATITDAATSVQQTLSTGANTVVTKVKDLYNSVVGNTSPAVPVVNVQASAAATSSFAWVWVLLAAGAAYVVYSFAKGKGKGKFFTSKSRVAGSAAKRYGK